MKREFGLENIRRDAASLVTVGSFDGVHLGHQQILSYLVGRAGRRAAKSVVVSFEPHPREVLEGEPMPLLTTIEERAELFEGFGLDRFIVLEFTREFSRLSAEDFVRQVLVETIGLQEIIVGYDHGFGRGRRGDTDLLREMGRELGFGVDVVSAHMVDSSAVSSSAVRRRLHAGDVRSAGELLGRSYSLEATVVRGRGRGRTIGFATANLQLRHAQKVVPGLGVYAVRVHAHGRWHGGMMNIGRRPTFEAQDAVHLEVHLFDFDASLYGSLVAVAFVDRVRDEVAFEGPAQLKRQLKADEIRCRTILEGTAVAPEPPTA